MKDSQNTVTEEKMALIFNNELGGKYTWIPKHIKADTQISQAQKLMNDLNFIEIPTPENQETHWASQENVKIIPIKHYAHKKQQEQDNPKEEPETTAPVATTTNETTATPKKKQSNWLLSPGQVETWNHETLVKKLKAHYHATGNADVFLAYLRMIHRIYCCDFLTLNRKIDRGDFYHEIRSVFNHKNNWSLQMIAALPEFKYMFTTQEWAILEKRWADQKLQYSKAELARTLPTLEASSEVTDAEAESTTEESQATKSKKGRKPTKKLRRLMKNLNNENNKQRQPKGLFF